ncbi:MAG TPA: hypothetical protein VFT45_18530 [Longimicrobium sp.]|nr:hypothetical protein [Longimicrobium sp.]
MSTLILILLLLSQFYVLGPLLFMATHRQPVLRTRRIPPMEAPADVAKAITGWRAFFGEAEFSLFAVQQVLQARSGGESDLAVSGHVLHLVDRAAAVHGLDYVTPAGRWQVFLTRFDDGQEVVTTNYGRVLTLDPHPAVHVVRMPGVVDLARLRALHAAHVARVMGAAAPAAIPGDEHLVNFVAEHELRTVERQRELGAMVRSGDVYRPTLRGAFRSVWRPLPPLRWINGSRESRVARSLREAVPLRDRAGLRQGA